MKLRREVRSPQGANLLDFNTEAANYIINPLQNGIKTRERLFWLLSVGNWTEKKGCVWELHLVSVSWEPVLLCVIDIAHKNSTIPFFPTSFTSSSALHQQAVCAQATLDIPAGGTKRYRILPLCQGAHGERWAQRRSKNTRPG